MMKRILPALFAAGLLASTAAGDLVVQRWGQYKYTQHKGVTFADGDGGLVMTIDLSALPKGAKVTRARLVFTAGSGYEVAADGKLLKLAEPYCLWFDATDAARAWAAAGKPKGALTIRRGKFKPEDAYLEIAWAGRLPVGDRRQQIKDVKAFHRHGQTFLTWTEIEDLAAGKEDVTWGEMIQKVNGCNPMVGIIPKWPEREIRYSVYRHTEPITADNIADAEFIHDVMQGSVYLEDAIARGKVGEQGPTFLKEGQVLRRVMLEKNKYLPLGTGFHWTNTAADGKYHYAVVTSINGVENTGDFSPANTAGPFDEKVAPPAPMLTAEKVTDLKKPEGAKWHEQWYSLWAAAPYSAYPAHYDVVLGYCPQTMDKAPVLTISRAAWDYPPTTARPGAATGLAMSHKMDVAIAFRMGPADFHYNLRSPEQAKWRPWPMNRQELLIDWLDATFHIDRSRITVAMGSWGMMEIERPDLYAMIHGYGQPGVTKGFQCWNRARGMWGDPSVYKDRPAEENPFLRADYGDYALANVARDTPFFMQYPIKSSHLTEMGWPPLPKFWRAMTDSRHPFVYNWAASHRPTFRCGQSVPAFGNGTLDGNCGNGDLRQGETFDTPINSWLSWDSESVVDEPDRWEMTIVLDGDAPLGECMVDLTPRVCQKFRPKEGAEFKYTVTTVDFKGNTDGSRTRSAPRHPPAQAGQALASGTVKADKYGLVTIVQMPLVAGAQRVVLAKK